MENPKSFLLMMPDYSDFPSLFKKNLEKEGFIPYVITDNPAEFRYQNFERYINFFQKTFLKNKNYKKQLVAKHKLKEYYKKIDAIDVELDYALVIRPDLFPTQAIDVLKKKTKKLIAYQWDGLEKFPQVKKYIPLFDRFFCFDAEDKKDTIKLITNFYFDCIPAHYKKYNTIKPKLYFVGIYWENREKKIDFFIEKLSKESVELSINIQYFNPSEIKNPKINYIQNRITFLENLKNVEQADVLVDFVDPVHNGLSIRFFEGLYYKKKVITDNKTVKDHDFYHPNNIFILDNNYDDISEFLKIPYHEQPEELVKKYSFSQWIKAIIKD